MELYLIRHGIAQEATNHIKDEERSLTEYGQKRTQKVAQRLKDLNLTFDVVATSPFVRAQQTAEILISAGLSLHLEECSYLVPDGNIQDWIQEWFLPKKYSSSTRLILVSHQPFLGRLAEILICGEAQDNLVLKKAGIIGIEIPETASLIGGCRMFWFTPPRYLLY